MDPFDEIEFDDSPGDAARPAPTAQPARRSLLLWLVAAGLGILVLPLSQIAQTVRADNARLNSELESAQTAVGQTPTVGKEVSELQATMSALQEQANLLGPLTKNLTGKQINWVDAASAIADYDHSRIALSGLEQHDNRIVIRGRADNDSAVMAYAQSLEATGKFSRVVVQSISGVSTPFTTPTITGASQTTPEAIYLGEPQSKTFNVPQQQHVLTFLAKAGRYYQVLTTNLAPGVDTSMSVTLDDGTSYVNDDAKPGVLSSEVDFQAPVENINATIRIDNMGRYGKDSTYQVVIKEVVPTPTPKAQSNSGSGSSSSASSSSSAANAAPTNTPAPTDTPKPTKTPVPTKTHVPTVVPTKPSTATPTATATQDLRDKYEPDNTTPTAIGVGGTQTRNFYPNGDTDAASFAAKKDKYYLVQTSNLVPGVDTAITVTEGGSQWDNDDAATAGPGNYASVVCFQAPAKGNAVVTVINNANQYGPNMTYDLSVSEVAGILTNPASLTFGPITEGDPAPAPHVLTLSSTVVTAWTAESDSSWLNIDTSGTTSSAMNVAVDPTGLSAGSYDGTITISWSSGCSKQIAVALEIDAPPPALPAAPSTDAPAEPPAAGAVSSTRFARLLPLSHQSGRVTGVTAGTPGPVAAVDFAILVEVQTVQP